jgi:hypothetical protein
MRQNIMRATILKYPLATCRVLIANSVNVFLDNHLLNNAANYFGYNWKPTAYVENSDVKYKQSLFCYYGTYLFMVVYLVLWASLSVFLLKSFRNKEYEYLYFVSFLMILFIVPGVLTGNCGSRFRLPFEPFLTVFAVYEFALWVQRIKAYFKLFNISRFPAKAQMH